MTLHPTESTGFNWHNLIDLPNISDDWKKGRQVLNFFPKDKDYRDLPEARAMVTKHFGNAKALDTDAAVLKYGSDHVAIAGAFLEMGVCTGRTINFIAALNPEQRIWGFDSFDGLPERWIRPDINVPRGSFGIKVDDWMPPVLHNVKLIKGLFHETLPKFKEHILKAGPIAFLHIDCDIYSSTKEIFDQLGDNITTGTVIVFDELYNYPAAEEHEFKAFQEFLDRTGKGVTYLAYNQYFEQAVVQIT
ncbi:TylF/MycF/NovP-related O-methyltransferase [Mycobacterium sp.]|uniref:TylF/MycF/NovP-related O-methyltransferase n=1 Tax=Mycobacterium sp. TaxID=1785 RepID=UPI003BAB422D